MLMNPHKRFSIWDLNELYTIFKKDIFDLNLRLSLKEKVVETEHNRIKILRYALDNNYHIQVKIHHNLLQVIHYWHGYIITQDLFEIKSEEILFLNEIKNLRSEIFNMILIGLMNSHYQLDSYYESIACELFNDAKFNPEQYQFIVDNFSDSKIVLKAQARLGLEDIRNA